MKNQFSKALVMGAVGALFVATGLSASAATAANTDSKDLLIKFANKNVVQSFAFGMRSEGAKVEQIGSGNWVHVKMTDKQSQTMSLADIRGNPEVLAVQPNYKIHLYNNWKLNDPLMREIVKAKYKAMAAGTGQAPAATVPADNQPIPAVGAGTTGTGADPDFTKQWGMVDIGVQKGWSMVRGKGVVVAVIDTGVDYTHEDLVGNIWHNPGEMGTDASGKDKSTNAVDDDGNGYVDDVIGWDFASNDNKPFDLAVEPIQILMGGGNPGHGTHCAGNVAARADNGIGTVGVAPEAQIMPLRFLSEKGEGDTAGAIKAIDYAVKNGAKVLSNSWGSEGDDPSEATQNQALKDSITAAQNAGVLFIAAAGNGHSGVGYDNDSDPKPGTPASYDMDNIISVAAVDSTDKLGSFSNWGAKTVDIAAPGVVVYSTTVGGHYSDTVIDMFGIKATWDGTSMACPHVAGAAALYWSKHPEATWKDVKNAILSTAKPVAALQGKMTSGGKLNVEALMQ